MSATNNFPYFEKNLNSPYTNGFAITKHDTNELTYITRAIMVGVSGDVAVVTVNDDSVTIPMIAGHEYRIMAKQVKSTGTAATGIIGLY